MVPSGTLPQQSFSHCDSATAYIALHSRVSETNHSQVKGGFGHENLTSQLPAKQERQSSAIKSDLNNNTITAESADLTTEATSPISLISLFFSFFLFFSFSISCSSYSDYQCRYATI